MSGPGAMRVEFEGSPKHGPIAREGVSAAPQNPQEALGSSLQISPNSPRRIGIDYETGEFVVFPRTSGFGKESEGVFHGYVQTWNELKPEMQKTLIENGLVNKRGRILY